MRLILFLVMVLSIDIRSQNTPSVQLSSGGVITISENSKSISQPEFLGPASSPPGQVILKTPDNSAVPASLAETSSSKIILPLALFVAIALVYIGKKNKQKNLNTEMATVSYESEEKDELKKEMWDHYASEQDEEEENNASGNKTNL